jgi:hypothetical protein
MDPGRVLLWHSPPDSLFPSYGLGWAVTQLAGRRLVQHSGEIPGTLSSVALLPEDGIGVAVSVCSPASAPHTVLSYQLLETALGLTPRDWQAASAADLEKRRVRVAAEAAAAANEHPPVDDDVDVAGTYRSAVAGDVSITGSGSSYVLEYPDARLWRQRLERVSGNRFHGRFTEPGGVAYNSGDAMLVSFRVEGGTPVELHHPFFGRAERLSA